MKQFSTPPTILSLMWKDMYAWWSCILNCLMLSSLVSMLFAHLLSLHLVKFLMFFLFLCNFASAPLRNDKQDEISTMQKLNTLGINL